MTILSLAVNRIAGTWASLASSGLLLLVAYVVSRRVYAWSRLRHFKGPWSAGFSRLWLVRSSTGGRLHLDLAEVSQKYGSLARIGPKTLLTSDPDVMRRMLNVRSPYRRSDWYVGARFNPKYDNVGSQRDEEKHTKLRAKMAAGYSGKEVENFEVLVDQNIASLVQLVGNYVSDGFKPMDLGRTAQYFTLDVISSVAYGKAFGYLAADSDLYDYLKTIEQILPSILMIGLYPSLNRLITMDFVQKYMPSERDPVGFGKIMAVAKKIVSERFGQDKKVLPDMLGSFVRHGLSEEEAESESLLQIVAGSDTTATAIRATFLHIITNPPVLSKLRQEIDNSTISSPIRDAEAKELPYLQAVIKEGLRIWPPFVGLMPKEVPPEGDVINGKFIPGGCTIAYCAFGIFRDKKIWGEDADVFRPERWLEGSPEETKKAESILDLIFGGGRWQCLGRSVAQMELNKVFVEVLRNFDLSICDPTNPWKSLCYGIFAQSEMWVTVSRREVV